MSKTALRIDADGTETILIATGKAFTLEELQRAVGGYIELVRLRDGRQMYCDEDAKRKAPSLAINDRATALFHAAGGVPWDVVLGPVVIIGKTRGKRAP